jgi:hypothetical protein
MVNANSGKSDNRNINTEELNKRKSDATSDETLSDLEKTETDSDSSSTDTGLDPGPAPDGAFDESDERKDAGPM